jgi:hypothetical protein
MSLSSACRARREEELKARKNSGRYLIPQSMNVSLDGVLNKTSKDTYTEYNLR